MAGGYELLSAVQLPCGASFEAVYGRGALEVEPVAPGVCVCACVCVAVCVRVCAQYVWCVLYELLTVVQLPCGVSFEAVYGGWHWK